LTWPGSEGRGTLFAVTNGATGTSLTADEIREKYRVEREKRLRSDGNAQYRDFTGIFKDYDADPYVEPGFTRDAVVDDVEVVIVGGGFGGMLTGARLHQAGITNFRIIEKGGDLGGTWYWNRYPGAACDVESYSYLPLLEETGYMPTEKYAKAPEIFAYCQLLGRTFGLYDGALFQTQVAGMVWNEQTHRWLVTTHRNDQLTARFVVIAGGVLHKAKLPGIPGIETFEGHSFHTSRWDYAYTGGSPTTPMVNLADKRVGIIGTGATAVQAIPNVAKDAGALYVFQRTPSAVAPRNNGPTDPEWFRSLKPGWQRERIRNFTSKITGKNPEVDLVQDGWTELLHPDTRMKPESPEHAAALEQIDFDNMAKIRTRIDTTVKDEATAEGLKPWYNILCKRPCFHDEYLDAFNRPNVHLVDTDGKGVERITPTGAVVDGVEIPLDCIMYASGFEVSSGYTHRLGFNPVGRKGVPLTEAWAEGPSTLHGIHTRGFPNMLMLSTVQGFQAVNFVHPITEVSAHIVQTIKRCVDENIKTLEPTPEAMEAWFWVLMGTVEGYARYNMTCTPGYLNNEGAAGDMKAARGSTYLGSAIDMLDILDRWRDAGDMAGLEVTR
jgi:cyclohexanone monooxygenase